MEGKLFDRPRPQWVDKKLLRRVHVRLHQEWLEVARHGDPFDLTSLSEALEIVDCLELGTPLPARFTKREDWRCGTH
jgi:hypothetical protein